jgi:hypothetical protein
MLVMTRSVKVKMNPFYTSNTTVILFTIQIHPLQNQEETVNLRLLGPQCRTLDVSTPLHGWIVHGD